MRRLKLEWYRDIAGDIRWRAFAPNGNNTANSGEGYKNREDAERALWRTAFKLAFGIYRVVDTTEK